MIVDGKYYLKAASYAILRDNDGRVLFLRRAGTGYMDGRLGLPSGHVERSESFRAAAIRELKEETGVLVADCSIKQVFSLHRYQKSGEHDYVDNFFEINEWDGAPVNNEPSKCSELVWANPDDIESEIVPYLTHVFKSIKNNEKYVEILRGDQE